VIELSNIKGDIIIDTISQTIQDGDGKAYYGRFTGSAMMVAPYRDLIHLPETWVKNIDQTDLVEYDTFYLHQSEDGYLVEVNPEVIKVSQD
jgi:hypothetical protein